MAAARNVMLKKKVEIGLAQTQDGGCVNEQIAGPPAQDDSPAQCNNIKKAGNNVSPDPRWRLCKKKMAAARNVILKNGRK
jgi:hypothetical protein